MAAVLAFAVILPHVSVEAADVIFKNGRRLKDARIVAQSEEFISLQVDQGVIRYPISAIESINGQTPGNGPIVDVPVAPAAQPASPALRPASPTAASSLPAGPSTRPAPGGANASIQSLADEPGAISQRFVIFLVVLLIGGGIWMRSVQAVQKSLFEREMDPRVWNLVAVLLPIVGAAIYFAVQRFRKMVTAARLRKHAAIARAAAAKEEPPAKSGTGQPFPVNKIPVVDPAEYLARKGKTRKGFEFLDSERKSIELKNNTDLVSGLVHAEDVLHEALLEKASDVHIEPTGGAYRVRFRLDGILHERMSYENIDGRRLVTSLKTLAQIDIAEKRRAQDGRFRVSVDGREVDFRVATANSIHGEKIVIRVLDQHSGIFNLTALGMSDEMLTQFQSIIGSKSGMILSTGPTGSGKTSTLYAALRELDATRLNIMTVEDPPEYELPGATQIAVNPKAGITYESGLRSILRQDPDVILIGEMRDAEAAAVALRAALTGHLVFSTLHTKDAVGTISRLQDIGTERYQLASGLLMVVAQRLVRVLCPKCRSEYSARGDELESIGFSFEPGASLYGPIGCDACHGTGFKGRTGLFELLVLDEDLRRAIGEGADEAALTAMAMERGFKSYRYDGAEKILRGVTTVEEVLQAA